jgi:TPR repeat protein
VLDQRSLPLLLAVVLLAACSRDETKNTAAPAPSASVSLLPAPTASAGADISVPVAFASCAAPRDCFDLASKAEAAVPADRGAARLAYGKACDGGLCAARNNLGVLQMTESVTPEVRRADAGPIATGAALFERACLAGCPSGCFNRARVLLTGEGAPQDVPAALARFDRACEQGDLGSCDYRAIVFESATDLPGLSGTKLMRDPVRAERLYRKACDGGYASSCANLAVFLERRGNVDAGVVQGLYGKGCDTGNAAACSNLGLLLETSGDGAGARSKYAAACDAGSPDGCGNLKSMNEGSLSRTRTSQASAWRHDAAP